MKKKMMIQESIRVNHFCSLLQGETPDMKFMSSLIIQLESLEKGKANCLKKLVITLSKIF